MPRAPKPCARCTRPVRGRTYCPECQPLGWAEHPSKRNTKHTRAELRAFSDAVLKAQPWCARGCGRRSVHADHVVPVALGGSNDPNTNGQGLCAPCHEAKTKAEARARARRP